MLIQAPPTTLFRHFRISSIALRYTMNQPFIRFSFRAGIFAIVLSTALSGGGCNPPTPIEKTAFSDAQLVALGPHHLLLGNDTLPYTLYHQAAYELNPDKYSQSDSTTISFWYPLIDSSAPVKIRDRLNAHIQAILLQETQQYHTVEERLAGFIAEFKAHKKDMEEFNLPSSNWAFDMRLSVLTNTPTVFVLRVDQLEFTGGAHANSWTSYKNYHAQSGQELALSELFYPNSQAAWLPLVRTAFWDAWQAQDSSLQPSIERDTATFVRPPNFSIGLTELHFYYNPYELDAYALAELSFYLPYDKLLPYIDTSTLPLVTQPL